MSSLAIIHTHIICSTVLVSWLSQTSLCLSNTHKYACMRLKFYNRIHILCTSCYALPFHHLYITYREALQHLCFDYWRKIHSSNKINMHKQYTIVLFKCFSVWHAVENPEEN